MANPYQSPSSSPLPARRTERVMVRDPADVEWQIRREAGNAFVAGILSLVGGVFFIPVALVSGRRAIRLIEQYGTGHEHYRKARRAISLAYLSIGLIGLVGLMYVLIGVVAILAG